MQNTDVINAIEKLSYAKRKYEEKKARKLGYTFFYDYFLDKVTAPNSQELNECQLKKNDLQKSKEPSKARIKSLLKYFHNHQYVNAEELAKSIINEFPNNIIGWKFLGFLYAHLGKNSEALIANYKVVKLSNQDSEAYNNLAITLHKLGRLQDAENNYKQAIALKPNFSEALINLSVILKKLGRLEENVEVCKKAITLKPNNALAHYNLGNTLQTQGKLDEAELCFRKAINLKPSYFQAYNNLGFLLQTLGRLKDAEVSYRQAISLDTNFIEPILNLATVLEDMNNFDAANDTFIKVFNIDKDIYKLKAGIKLAILNFLKEDFVESRKYLFAVSNIQETIYLNLKNEKVYYNYLLKLLNWHEVRYSDNFNRKVIETLFVIGESHSLTSHNLYLKQSEGEVFCKSKLIYGCKQWHLGNSNINHFKIKFESIFYSLPKSSKVLLTFGEIDCRLDSGIIKHVTKYPQNSIKKTINATVENYINYIAKLNLIMNHEITIQGVPCPNIDTKASSRKDINLLVEVIKLFNMKLKSISKSKDFSFLDLHKLTDSGEGISNKTWHIDDYHLSPDGMIEAWSKYIS